MKNRTPPTNCRCVWKLDLAGDRVTWLRADHVPGCPVHGADQVDPDWLSPSTVRFRVDAADPDGLTVDELLAFVAGLIESGVNRRARIRAGWRTLRRIEAYK